MEMNVNIAVIKSNRNKRAWSQSQLAEVAGLSLRTIQRIEKSGSASLESVKAIASVFELDVIELHENAQKPVRRIKAKMFGVIGGACIAISSFLTLTASAQPVMIDFELKSNGAIVSGAHILNDENIKGEIVISDNIKVNLSSKIEEDGTITIYTEIFDISSQHDKLIATPVLSTNDRVKAKIVIGALEMSLTPRL